MTSEPGFAAIVLAAQRGGVENPLAAAHGVARKCLVPIAGKPLIAHVLDTLTAMPGARLVRVSIEEDAVAELGGLVAGFAPRGVPVDFASSRPGIADSVLAAAEGLDGPVIVTTADNVLLTAETVAQMLSIIARGVDVVPCLATKASVLAAHPEGQRGFYQFRDDAYANCNLYGFADPRAFEAAKIFRGGGQFMKNPKRLARAFGLINILLVRFRLLSLQGAMRRLSRRFALRFEALIPSDGAQAIDVDEARTYRVADEILLARRATSPIEPRVACS